MFRDLPFPIVVIAAAAMSLAVAAALRIWLIEVPAIGWRCNVADPPTWCFAFQGLGIFLRAQIFGAVCLILAIVAFFADSRTLAVAAVAAGAAALVLYNAEFGAAAVLLGAVRAVRL